MHPVIDFHATLSSVQSINQYKNIRTKFDVFLTVHHSTELFHQPTLMHNFLYSLTICLLHYYPRHVLSINMPILRRKNCIHTASGIFALELRPDIEVARHFIQKFYDEANVCIAALNKIH